MAKKKQPHEIRPAVATPGPWVTEMLPSGEVEIVAGQDNVPMALVYGADTDPNCWPVSANARLMAAAPDLLACVRYTVARLERENPNDGLLHDCRAAIAKATDSK